MTSAAMIKLRPPARWAAAEEFAAMVELSARRLRELEHHGLPSWLKDGRKVYPLPDGLAWMWAYSNRARDERRAPAWLDLDLAIAEYTLKNVRDLAELREIRPMYDQDGCRLLEDADFLESFHQRARK